jgi:hypothetical protein
LTPSTAALIIALAVLFAADSRIPVDSNTVSASGGGVPFRAVSVVPEESGGSNHGVWKSKSATTRMKRRSEQ